MICFVSAEALGSVKLEELLVEQTWLEALPGELQKPYAKNLCKFVGQEMSSSIPIYPPPYLIFNTLNSTTFDNVRVVIIGQVMPVDLYFQNDTAHSSENEICISLFEV